MIVTDLLMHFMKQNEGYKRSRERKQSAIDALIAFATPVCVVSASYILATMPKVPELDELPVPVLVQAVKFCHRVTCTITWKDYIEKYSPHFTLNDPSRHKRATMVAFLRCNLQPENAGEEAHKGIKLLSRFIKWQKTIHDEELDSLKPSSSTPAAKDGGYSAWHLVATTKSHPRQAPPARVAFLPSASTFTSCGSRLVGDSYDPAAIVHVFLCMAPAASLSLLPMNPFSLLYRTTLLLQPIVSFGIGLAIITNCRPTKRDGSAPPGASSPRPAAPCACWRWIAKCARRSTTSPRCWACAWSIILGPCF